VPSSLADPGVASVAALFQFLCDGAYKNTSAMM
jgi:hypothetical protein